MIRRVLIISALLALPALAGPREDTMSGIARCSLIADDRTYLDCIYGAAQPLRARLGLPPAPVAQQRLVPLPGGYAPPPAPVYAAPPVASPPRPVMTPQARQVGMVDSLLGNDPSAGWIEVYSFDGHGLFTITFSNGQVWRQNADDPARAHWTGRGSDHSIKFAIDSSGRGGQLMVRGDAATYQVHRLR
jgi:hypothetical protein